MLHDNDYIRGRVFERISALLPAGGASVTDDTPLLGSAAQLDSMKLVELCLALEDDAAELGAEFDWTSAAAMSRTRSMFRTAGTLADEFLRQLVSRG